MLHNHTVPQSTHDLRCFEGLLRLHPSADYSPHMRSLFSVFLLSVLAVGNVFAADRVSEFRGKGNMTTSIFRVESPWVLDWRLDGDYDQLVALEITLVEARTGKYVGRVLRTKHKGNGVKLFRSSGLYQLRISSTLARWTIKIDQLTNSEAESYTPK